MKWNHCSNHNIVPTFHGRRIESLALESQEGESSNSRHFARIALFSPFHSSLPRADLKRDTYSVQGECFAFKILGFWIIQQSPFPTPLIFEHLFSLSSFFFHGTGNVSSSQERLPQINLTRCRNNLVFPLSKSIYSLLVDLKKWKLRINRSWDFVKNWKKNRANRFIVSFNSFPRILKSVVDEIFKKRTR